MPEFKRSNPKGLSLLGATLDAISDVTGKVGWFESARYENGVSVAYVASIQELGATTGHGVIPPRPFMRTTASEQKEQWAQIAAQVSREIIQGKRAPQDAMQALTLKAEGDVGKKIAEITEPPLSPVTLEIRAMKKHNPDLQITAATVGEAARRVKEPGYQTPDVSTKPLNFTGHMIATLTSTVEKE